MCSLLQFSGETGRQGVRLIFYLVKTDRKDPSRSPILCDYKEQYPCLKDAGKKHPSLYQAWRKPKGTMGQWVIFRYNGQDHVPDLSIPIPIFKIPQGAKRMSDEDACAYWHSE